MNRSSEPGVIAAGLPAASFVRRGRGGAARSRRAVPYLRRQLRSRSRHARAALTLAGIAVLAIPLLAAPAGAQQPPARAGAGLPVRAVQQIEALLAAKAQRTAAQRKVSSQLLDAAETAQLPETEGIAQQPRGPAVSALQREAGADAMAEPERVTVDIRADVTPAVLDRIRALGGTVINSVPKYRAIRAQLPVTAIERLAALAAVQTIRPADEAVTRKDNTTQGDAAHRANAARTTYSVDGTGIGIGVISNGVRTLADRQASGDLPARVTVLPGQEGSGDEGTALLEIVHDLAPGADLYFATGNGGQARMAVNIEALCEAGVNVIVDDIGYLSEAAFQDDIVAKGVNAAVAGGCVFFSAGGNDGNLTHGTSGVWEGDYAAGTSLIVDGETLGVRHDFGGGVEANELEGGSVRTINLQWADPLGASTNDYDLFLVNENGDVVASSTDTQDGTQDPVEVISSPIFNYSGLSVVVVKASGANRYLRVQAFGGRLAVATAGTLFGHSAQENAISVAMVDVATAGGSGGVFDGTESVRSSNSDGPRRIFFEADGTAITAGNFSATGGKLLQKPDLTAATCVTTATPGFSPFCGTSAAAPHAAAIGALMLEAAGGPDQVTLAQLRMAMTGAALDIEATGVDRDSGAGIVMAPAAVDAVDVAVADRNAAPTVTSSQSDRTFAAGAAAVTIDLATVFGDPDAADTLDYEAVSSDPDRLAVTRSGAMATLTPGSPGRAVVTLRAIDPDGLSAVETFSVTVTAGNRDYDADNDGLIDVGNLAQLDAIRYDLDGDGLVDGATWMPYYDAFPMGALGMGCPTEDGCTGYELTADDLDFDTDDDGDVDSDDDYWDGGDGWDPIGEADAPFTADFNGNRRTVSNLFINRDTEDGVGLFGASNRSVMRGVGLVGVDVTGGDRVGSLLGHGVYGVVIDSSATGSVSGTDEVGGLVGRTWGRVRYSWAAVNVSGADAVGGLVGHQLLNNLDSSYATGNVEGMNAVGGLVGAVSDRYQVIWASYATGDVSGGGARLSESDSGFIICDGLGFFTTSGPVETPTSSGGGVGGLVGSSCGVIEASYATGAVSGDVAVGGLVGSGQYIRVRAGYWDLETSGIRVGVGEDDENDNGVIDGTESQRLGVGGKTTAELQTPTGYTGIYAAWNVDLWNFGTTTQYPALSVDFNDDNRATWQEFGYQVRDGLTLTATTMESQAQVVLSWDAVSTSSWSPAPDVSYTLYRDDGTTVEAIAENLTGLSHTDTGVTIDDDYTYWVAAVVDGGEAARSAPVSVIAGVGNQPPVAVGIVADRELLVGATAVVVDVAGAFDDPDDDTLTYAASSSVTSVATLSRSGSMITITPASAGRTIITVTATDAGGSNTSVSQRFKVTVGHDYDTDKDGLIGISNLAQFDAVRHDLDGNGVPVSAGSAAYAAAFPDAFDRLGCGIDGCSGYELTKDLYFDTDGDGSADAGDTYWNAGEGWEPIGLPRGRFFGTLLGAFNATFDGNGHALANLFVARDDHAGLFGAIGSSGVVHDVRLAAVDVTGKQHVGGLAGENHGVVSRVQSAGRVSGEVQVGGLVGANLGTITLSRSSAAVTGMAPPDFVRTSDLDRGTGGLVGYNGGAIRGSYAAGRVVGDSRVGGLVGWNFNDGFVGAARSHASIVGSYATGSVAGRSSVGGLVGTNGIPGNLPFVLGEIKASYATGRVSGPARGVGGLVGYDSGDDSTIITASYWDTNTSGQTSGSFGIGRTTAQLKAPTGYSGIYGSWNVDVDGDGRNNAPWHFGTGSQYPVLKANVDGQGSATWQEFGYQFRSGPTLMTPTVTPTMTPGQAQVALDWTAVAVDAGSWTPEPDVTYTVTRADGSTVETLAEDLEVLLYTDSAARTGATLSYQVIAVVDGGEPVRSAVVEVTTSGNSPPLPVGTLSDRWLHADDAAGVEVGGAFEDPEGDTLTYTAASSAPGVVTVSVSGSRVTLTPVAAGTATITVTATDAGGSMAGGTQTLTVTVQPLSATDYDTDDDGLIEITTLARLDAIRHDLDGDGVPTTDGATAYAAAFSTVGDRQACGGLTGCVGYELADNLDFDTNGDGSAGAGDTYWNGGAGWEPIKTAPTPGVIVFGAGFQAIFEGNGHTIANLFIDRDSNVGLFGGTSYGSVIRHVGLIDVMVSGSSNVGGLAGTANGSVIGSYVTGTVTGTGGGVGGLAGATWGSLVVASYAAVEVTGGNNVGGLIGENDAAVTASYATGWVAGDDNVGGLVGSNGRTITASYATGPVAGVRNVGGLVGRNRLSGSTGTVTTSYWDTSTSGQTTGSGRTTAQLQAPTSYSGIYQTWNVDLDSDSVSDNPWDFGTAAHYPALAVDFDGNGEATWQEFGHQLRSGPVLTAIAGPAQVALSWTPVDVSVWTSAPSVTYAIHRDDGTTVETVAANLDGRQYSDTGVIAGTTYTYQVAALVQGGEATRSARVSARLEMLARSVVALKLMPDSIGENGGVSTVTASLDRASSAMTTVTVSAMAVDPAVSNDFMLSTNKTLTIPAGQTDSTGTVTVRAMNNTVDSPNKTVTVSATADNMQGVRPPAAVTLAIVDDDTAPAVTLLLTPDSIGENSAVTTVTATLDRASSAVTTVTVSAMAVDPAVSNDFMLSTNRTLTIPAGQTDSTGTVTITGKNNTADSPDKTVRVSGAARNTQGVTGNPPPLTLTITDDDPAPEVTLKLMPDSISENRGVSTVTARLDRKSSETTTVTVSATAVSPAVEGDFALSMNTTLTITAGQTTSTGTVTITANDNDADTPDNTVRVSGAADNSHGVTDPADVTLTITDDDDPPTVTLGLMPTSIGENSGSTTVTARLNRTSSETTTVTVSATAVSPAVADDFTLSTNKTLTITAGQTTSTGTVTITANNNDADTPDNTVRVSGTVTNSAGVTAPSDVTLTIIDEDDPPMVTLELMPTSIDENGGSTTVTARLNRTSSETTTVTVSAMAVSPAVSRDFRLSSNKTLTITAGQATSTGTVTLTANNNDADTPDNTVRVSGTARNRHGVTNPDDEELTITDDDDPPTVMLRLSRTSINENGGSATVRARLDRTSSETTTVTISATAVSPAVAGDFALSINTTLTITAGQTTSTGTVTLTANDNDADTPDNTVRVSGAADNSHGVRDPDDEDLTITDDDDPPTVMLRLSRTSIGENSGSTTVTARLDRESSETTTVTVSATAVSPAVADDFTLSPNKTLTFTAGQTTSTGLVTITANNNDVDTTNKTVRVSGTADNSHGVTDPDDEELTITDDDDAPELTLTVRPSSISESGGSATVTIEITNGAAFAENQRIPLAFAGTASKRTDYTVALEQLTLTAGENSVATTVTAMDDAIDDDAETILVTARHGGGMIGTERSITITDDDASPVIVTGSPILVAENETAVATLTASDADRPAEDLTWRITGGADRSRFRLTSDGVLTFASAEDYERLGDSDRNGDYEVTVEVSDGANSVEAVFTVRLEDVDDIAPALSSASVNGATLTLTYGEALDPNSRPAATDFTVSGGNSARTVSNVAVSGQAVTLTLDPAVEHGETGIRVSYRPGANPIQDAAGNDAVRLSNERVTNNTGDTTAPTVRTVAITSRPERNATYAAGKEIEVTVTFSETVVVTGTPRLRLNVGGVSRTAAYRSGTGAAAVFVYVVADGESDADGVSIEANSLTGTIRDGADNNALLNHDGLPADARHKVDGVKPALAASGGAVVNGATLTLTYGEALDGSSRPVALAFTVNVEGAERRVSRVAVSGTAVTLTLESEVGVGQAVRLTYRAPGANSIQDTVGNDAGALTNRAVENDTRDTTAPRVSRVAITSNPGPDGTYAEEDVIEVTVTFSETVRVDTANGTPSLSLTVGRRSKPALYSPGPASVTQRFNYTVGDSDIDTDGVSIAAGRIALNGGTIEDLADNPSLRAYEAVPPQPSHAVDGVRPVLQGATVNGDTLTLTYGEALDEDSTPAADDFTVDVASAERLLVEVLVGGRTVTLTLVSEVTPGQTVTVSYTARTRPIQDAAGNAAEDLTEYTVGTPPPIIVRPPPPPPPPITGGGGGGGGGARARPPSYPGTIRAAGGDGEVTLTWNAPSSQGSSRILYYEYRIDGEGEWISTGSPDRIHTITGLINGRVYFFHLRAVSAAGAGAHRISPEATPVADLDFTHFANGGFITSTLALVNAGAYPVRPAIYFYDQDGDPIAARRVVDLTPDLEVADDGALSPRTVMNPLSELTIATHGRGGQRVGSVTVRAPSSIGGVLRFDIPNLGVAGVGDSPTLRDALLPVRRQEMGINTGVAVRNRGTGTLTLQCRLMRDGAVLEETMIPLAANGQDSRFIDQVFPATDTSDFAGSVRCAAPEPGRFSAVAFELDAVHRIFTTLPVVPVPAVPEQEQGQEDEQDQEPEQEPEPARLDFTHFANGGDIVSELVLVNPGADSIRPAIYFYDQQGDPIAVESVVDITGDLEMGDGGALSPRTAIDPLGELTIATHGRGGQVVGSVAVAAEGPIGGVLRFDIPALGVAGVGDSPPVRDALVPVRRQDGGINTGVAIHNRGESPLLVRCRLMRDGAVLDETMIPLAANGQDSRFIDQVFPTADTSDFAGSVRCLTPEPGRFSAVAFELDGVHRIFTTLPVVPVVEVP